MYKKRVDVVVANILANGVWARNYIWKGRSLLAKALSYDWLVYYVTYQLLCMHSLVLTCMVLLWIKPFIHLLKEKQTQVKNTRSSAWIMRMLSYYNNLNKNALVISLKHNNNNNCYYYYISALVYVLKKKSKGIKALLLLKSK